MKDEQAPFSRSSSCLLNLTHKSHESPWVAGKQPLLLESFSLFSSSPLFLSFLFCLFLVSSLLFSVHLSPLFSSLFSCLLHIFLSSPPSLHSHPHSLFLLSLISMSSHFPHLLGVSQDLRLLPLLGAPPGYLPSIRWGRGALSHTLGGQKPSTFTSH